MFNHAYFESLKLLTPRSLALGIRSYEDGSRAHLVVLGRAIYKGLLALSGAAGRELHDAVAVFAALVIFYVFLGLHPLMQVAHIEVLRVLHVEVFEDVAPLEAGESWLAFALVCQNHPRLSFFTVLEVSLEDVVFFERHFLVANRAHVVVVAVINVSSIWIHQADFEGFPGRLRCVLGSHILRAARLVENSGLSLNAKVFAQLIEPAQNR